MGERSAVVRGVRLVVVHVVLVAVLLTATPLVQPALADAFFATGREVCEGEMAGRHTHPSGSGLSPGFGYEVSAITVPSGATLTVELTGRKVSGSGVLDALTAVKVRTGGGTVYAVGSPGFQWVFQSTQWSTAVGSWTNTTGSDLVGTFEFGLTYAHLDYRMQVSIGGLPTASCQASALLASEFFGPSGSLDHACPCRMGTERSIDTWTGNEHFRLPGLDAGGRGPGIGFELAYNSGDVAAAGVAGHGWSSTYDMSMTVEADGSRLVHQETGATVPFYPNGGGGWVAPVRHTAELTESGGVWTFTRQNFDEFDFDSSGRLVAIRDRNGHGVTVLYDGSDRVSSVAHDDGRELSFAYSGNDVTISDPISRTVVLHLDVNGDLIGYTDTGGGEWDLGYDTEHRLQTVRTPRHASASSPQPVFEFHYDAQGRADWEEDELDRRTTLYYDDPVGGATRRVGPDGDQQVDYYSDGRLTKVTYAYGTAEAYSLDRTYDVATLAPLTTTVDPGGLNLTTTSEYDARGNLTETTDPSSRVSTATYNAFDQPLTVTDPSGVVTTYTYDANGNLEKVQTPAADPAGTRTIDPVYDPAKPGDLTSLIDERGKTWLYEYDTYGFLNKTISPAPDSDTTTMVNNTIGWVTSTVAPKGNAPGGTPATYTTTPTYNGYGQVTGSTGPSGTIGRQYWPGGLLKQVTDQSSQVTSYAYSHAGELTAVTRPGGSVLATEYFSDGLMKAQIDAATPGARTEYTYDAANRLKTLKDPLGRITTYGYDNASRLRTKQQPGGNCATTTACVNYDYFANGQLQKVNYSDTTPDVTYTYDPNGRPLTMADGGAAPAAWDWDDLGRLKSYTDDSGAVAYAYTGMSGLANTITYPGGKVVTQTYDNAGQMTGVTDWASRATAFDFDPNGNLDLTTFPAATTNADDYAYDSADRLTGVTYKKSATTIGTLSFTRSHAEGYVSASTATGSGVGAASETYDYSGLDQLNNVNGNAQTYDAADNLTGFPDGRLQKFNAANELCYQATTVTAACGTPPADATTYTYDTRGNRTTEVDAAGFGRGLTYDQADRLTSVTAGTHSIAPLDQMDSEPAAGDFDDDGKDDVFWYRAGSGGDFVTWGASRSTFGKEATAFNINNTYVHTAGDFNGDGYSDVLWYSPSGGDTIWFSFGRDGGIDDTQVVSVPTTGTFVPVVGDYDNDGFDDVFFYLVGTGADTMWWGNADVDDGTAFTATTMAVTASYQPFAGDFDGNGYDDIFWYSPSGTDTIWWHQGSRGTIVTTNPTIGTGFETVAGDFDGDGRDDALFYASGSTTDSIWWGNTTRANFSSSPSTYTVNSSYDPFAGDFDGDGRTDLFWYAPGAGTDTVWWGHPTRASVGTDPAHTGLPAVGATSTYSYAGDGLRRSKTTADGSTTTYTWDRSRGLPLLLAETINATGTSNDKTIRYIYGPDGRVVEQITTIGATDTPLWYHHDQLGSTRALTDLNGNSVGTATYTPAGKTTATTGTTTNIGWAGEYKDTETGYVYLRARHYDPATGQFLTRDPIEALTRSPYAYVSNNPINGTDPTGLFCVGSLCTPEIDLPDCPFGKNPNGSCRGSDVENVIHAVNTASSYVSAVAGGCTALGAASIVGAPLAVVCGTVAAGAATVNLGTGAALSVTGNKSYGSLAIDTALVGAGSASTKLVSTGARIAGASTRSGGLLALLGVPTCGQVGGVALGGLGLTSAYFTTLTSTLWTGVGWG